MPKTAQEIFDAIPGRFNPGAAAGWNAVIQFVLEGEGGGNWTITVKDQTCTASQGTADAPTATVKTSAEAWVGIASGTINPMTAFMTGKLSVQGNIGDVMKLQSPEVFRKA